MIAWRAEKPSKNRSRVCLSPCARLNLGAMRASSRKPSVSEQIPPVWTGCGRFRDSSSRKHTALLEFGTRPRFVVQHAFNHAPRGPVHEAAASALPAVGAALLARRWFAKDPYNPGPYLLRTLEGHTDQVNSVSVTPDCRLAVSASADKTLRLWDLETGVCLRVLEGHADNVTSVGVTPDGRRAVSASWDYTLQVWDLETGISLRVLEGHAGPVTSVSVTPDGRRAVSCSGDIWGYGEGDDNSLRVWDLETGSCLRVLDGHTNAVVAVSITPDGGRAVSASWDWTLRLWDLDTSACLRVLEGHSEQ